MKLNLKLRHKIQLIIISVSVVIFLGAIGYISIKGKKTAYKNTVSLIEAQSDNYSNKIQGLINEDFAVVSTLGDAFKAYDFLPKNEWQKLIKIMYRKVFEANPSFYQMWDSWELQYIDTSYNKPYGRISNTILRNSEGRIDTTTSLRSMNGDPKLYKKNKAKNTDFITNIYTDVFSEKEQERKLMATLWESITVNGNYIGMVGLDITLDQFQDIVNDIEIKNIDGSHAFLLTHDAKYAAHPAEDSVNTKAKQNPSEKEHFDLYAKIETGEKFNIIRKKDREKKRYVTYAPIEIGDTGMYWYLGISAPISSIKKEANRNFLISLIVGLIGLIILSTVIYWVAKNITIPIEKITEQLKQLSRGRINNTLKLEYETGDEIEEMGKAFNKTIDDLNKKSEFAQQLGRGELDQEFNLTDEEDHLGKSLIEMRDSLKKAREEETKRKEEDKKRQWVNEGVAKFGDILRQNNDNLEELSYQIIRNIVTYLNANQGGLFLLNDEDKNDIFYELKAAYAYNRRKYLQKQIRLGEGLVGTCAIEKNTIYMTEIPQDYIEITSGLGDATPDSLLIVPLKTEEEVLGVLEIASFNKFEKYQIEFVEKIAESIASTIQSVRVNLKTNELLEKSQQQAEEMSSQEEEMRQNMEELQATQEESARRERELNSTIEAINNFLLKAEMDTEGNLLEMNPLFTETFEYSTEELKNMSIYALLNKQEKEKFNSLIEQVVNGNDAKETLKFKTKSDKNLWLISSLTPYKDDQGNITKIFFIALDHTESENEKLEMRKKLGKK
jgi:methyl-accepting chemotaxis protein